MKEQRIGTIDHYYSHLGVITMTLEGELKAGDTIHIKGHTSDFTEKIDSIQVNHKPVMSARNGEGVGLKVSEHGRTGDVVYRVIEE